MIAGSVLILGLFALYQYRGVIVRRRLIARRPWSNAADWFENHYPCPPDSREVIRKVLEALAKDIGVSWTQLRPTDSFEKILRVPRQYSPMDELEDAEFEIVRIARELEIDVHGLPPFRGSLREFLDRILLEAQRSHAVPQI